MAVAARMTADEYLASSDEVLHSELVEGEIVVGEATPLHQVVCRDLLLELVRWTAAESGRGEVSLPIDVKIDERNVYGPDLLWYAEGRSPGRATTRPSPVPDIAVEVRSPSTWRYDIGAKKAGYERVGLPELWLVDTAAEAVLVFRRSRPDVATFDVALECGADDELTSPLLPGLRLALRRLFPA